jgi:hypothetical protein
MASFTHERYRYIMHSALQSGYKFISYSDLRNHLTSTQNICLLRHDCDNDLSAALSIARIESEMGIRSTYFVMLRSAIYNLMSFPCKHIVKEIISLGHWIGLHFDAQPYENSESHDIAIHVDQERAWLSEEFNVLVDVVSFHQPSFRILDNQIKLNCLNTYDRFDMAGVHYLSDSNMSWKEGCPSHLFHQHQYQKLQLLLHPEWWTTKEINLDQKWMMILFNQFDIIQSSLMEREATYNSLRLFQIDHVDIASLQ